MNYIQNPTARLWTMPPPFDFALTARAARFYAVTGRVIETDGQIEYRRAVRAGDGQAVIGLRAVDTTVTGRVIASAGAVDETALWAAVTRIVHPPDGVAPLAGFYVAIQHDRALAETVARLHGLGVLHSPSVWESLLVTLIEQQITLKQAQQAERWLAATHGDSLAVTDDGEYTALPTAQRLAALTLDDLRPLKITFGRIERLLTVARRIAAGDLDLEAAAHLPLPAAYALLRGLPGVGHWTAAWTLIRSRGAFYEIGGADVALRAAVNHYVYGLPGRAAVDTMAGYFASFGSWAGLAQFYLLTRWAVERY